MLNKQAWTSCKKWCPTAWGLGEGLKNPNHKNLTSHDTEYAASNWNRSEDCNGSFGTQDRDMWWALVTMIKNLQAP